MQDPQEKNMPICPVCGQECAKIHRLRFAGMVVGCDECVETVDALEWCEEGRE